MPGIYGSVQFVVGKPSAPKPVNSGTCTKCGRTSYLQTFKPGEGWSWTHEGCRPQTWKERRYRRDGSPYGYIPRSYDIPEGGTKFDPALGAAIERSRARD
jgi:hypothetical protein